MVKQATGRENPPEALERALAVIDLLANEVGPRRPTGRGERVAAELLVDDLRRSGVSAEIEPFRGYSSFGLPFGLIQATTLAPSLLPARMRRVRALIAAAASATLLGEGSLRAPLLSRLLSGRESGNVVATIEPRGSVERTVCLTCHMDTSRSGLMFHPRFVRLLAPWIAIQSATGAALGVAEPVLGRSARGRAILAIARAVPALGLALLLERELRGIDVPGANDNASGCGVATVLAAEAAAGPLGSTRVVLLISGCEESGTLGAQAFLRAHQTDGWLFLNFDNVGGDCSLRFLRREGVLARWDADPALIEVAQEVADRRPELRMAPEDAPAGLTYDSSPVHARGGRALTLSVQDGYIPNLHWPTDTYENVDPDGVWRTLEAGREMLGSIDAGAADQ
jgi:hypothetical protein